MISAVHPGWAVPGARIVIHGSGLPVTADRPPRVRVGGEPAHVVFASTSAIAVLVPPTLEGGAAAIAIEGEPDDRMSVRVARTLATGLHQVDNPAFDGLGRLYVTHSGGRGVKVPVPIYRVARDGVREPLAVELPNPTSLALGPDGAMYVSSRFEGTVYRLGTDDRVEVYASELGVPTGLAFANGSLFVGDRSGSIFRVSATRHVDVYATLPASIAAFHLAAGPDGSLYVSAPTLASRDAVYRITTDRQVETVTDQFGRPQGLAFDPAGGLYVVEALAGASGLFRVDPSRPDAPPVLVVAAPAIVGVAFDPDGGVALASNDVVWRIDDDLAAPRARQNPRPN